MTLIEAAQAVVDRWDSPKWKDQPHTAEFIEALRKAIKNEQSQIDEAFDRGVEHGKEIGQYKCGH